MSRVLKEIKSFRVKGDIIDETYTLRYSIKNEKNE